tara:strand:- start:18073 stop:18336 length:264 start_codon:yes stop_codon:yes gene_type:complete
MFNTIVERIIQTIAKRVERKINKRLIAELDEVSLISKAAKHRLHRELDGFAGIIANSNTQIEAYLKPRLTRIEQRLQALDKKILKDE